MNKWIKPLAIFTVLFMAAIPVCAQQAGESEKADVLGEQKAGGVKSIEERVANLEEAIDRPVEGGKWYDRIQIGGLIEVEAGYQSVDTGDETEDSSDIDLATVELVVDARIAEHVDGHVLVKYEDDDVFLDEGFITLTGTETIPVYLIAGRQYLPFGNYPSSFVTDPNTLLLGETNEGAAVAGYRFGGEMVDVSAGVFNGSAQEDGDDDHIDSFVGSVTAQPFDMLSLGASYTSNLAGSDTFNEFVVDPEALESLVGGWSAFVTLSLFERLTVVGEYVAALSEFEAGEVYDAADAEERRPAAWNVEVGFAILENLEVAGRYGGSDDGGPEFLPETQYGGVVNWGFYSCNLALEYLRDEFEDDAQEVDTITAQLAVEF